MAIYLDKRIETVSAVFGVSAAAGAFVPVNPLLKPHQLAHILLDSAARVLVTSAERFPVVRDDLDDCKELEYVILVGASDEAAPAGASYDVAALGGRARHHGGRPGG